MLTVQGEVTLSMIFKDNIEGFKQKIECKKSQRRAPVAKPWLQVSFFVHRFCRKPGKLKVPSWTRRLGLCNYTSSISIYTLYGLK